MAPNKKAAYPGCVRTQQKEVASLSLLDQNNDSAASEQQAFFSQSELPFYGCHHEMEYGWMQLKNGSFVPGLRCRLCRCVKRISSRNYGPPPTRDTR
jgi:hypothetical protein